MNPPFKVLYVLTTTACLFFLAAPTTSFSTLTTPETAAATRASSLGQRNLNVDFNLSSIVPVSVEEAAVVLHSDIMEVRFEPTRFGLFMFPKHPNGTTREEFWIHLQMTGFEEYLCSKMLANGWLEECSPSNYSVPFDDRSEWSVALSEHTPNQVDLSARDLGRDGEGVFVISTFLTGETEEEREFQSLGGAIRRVKVTPNSLKISFTVSNYTPISIPVSQMENPLEDQLLRFTWGTRITLSHPIEYTPLGPAEIVLQTGTPYHAEFRIHPIIRDFYVQFIQTNFSVNEPASTSRFLWPKEQWGFEPAETAYDYESFSNRSFYFDINFPGGRNVLYDPDVAILLTGNNKDQERSGEDEDNQDLIMGLTISLSLLTLLVVVTVCIAFYVYLKRKRRLEAAKSVSQRQSVNFGYQTPLPAEPSEILL
ncbi:hypothetical protein QOT17_004691 [Balamuthia mandrillaris]